MSTFELVVPDHLSRSQVDTYSDCGRKWLLERGMRVPRVPAWALLGGSAVHAVTEEYDKAALDGTELDDAYLREAFALDLESRIREEEDLFSVPRARFSVSGRASKDWPNKEDEAWWKHHGPAMVLNWKSWRRVTPWELLPIPNEETGEFIEPIEYSFKLDLDGVSDWGAIDRVFTYQGELIVVDLKTGRNAPKKGDQLGDYATAVEVAVGKRPTYGFYWMAREGGTTEAYALDRPRMSKDGMAKTFAMTMKGIESGVFLANVGMLCNYCSVRDFCSAVDGPRSSEIEV